LGGHGKKNGSEEKFFVARQKNTLSVRIRRNADSAVFAEKFR
jgi:hypothetical protein